jgi:hypothetical protein
MVVPTSFFLTSGVGVHRDRLTAFELALRDADIEQQNWLVYRPFCRLIASRSNGRKALVRCGLAKSPFV